MQATVQFPWPGALATGMMLVGLFVAGRGIRLCHAAWPHPLVDLIDGLRWMRGFRIMIWGLALLGLGTGWLWHLPWLIALSLIIGVEETLESSLNIAALARERRTRPATRGLDRKKP